MQTQWIVVSDAAEARIFTRDAVDLNLTLVDTLDHQQTRAHDGDLRTGGKGAVHNQSGSGRHQPDPQTTTTEKHADIFAKQLAERLKAGFNDNAFTDLVIVADPSFLGRIREHIDRPIKKALTKTIDKNWAQRPQSQIERQLANQLDH